VLAPPLRSGGLFRAAYAGAGTDGRQIAGQVRPAVGGDGMGMRPHRDRVAMRVGDGEAIAGQEDAVG